VPGLQADGDGAFHVRLAVFEGPLDLLLRLIERRQLDISKVALAEVADSFLAYIESHPHMPPAPLASFVWVASKLLWIKSQALLPRPPVSRAEEEEEDPGDELVRRLEAYRRVQEAARWLRLREQQGLRSYERPAPLNAVELRQTKAGSTDGARAHMQMQVSTALEGVTLSMLVRVVQKRMQLRLPADPPRPAGMVTTGHTITVAHRVAHLRARLNRLKAGERMPLGEDFAEAAARSRAELVVLFLAVLEIIRRGLGLAEQDELFGEIWLSRTINTEQA
jgi:segregation and condensation protein A